MTHSAPAHMPFYQALNCATTLECVAQLLCAQAQHYLPSQHVHCTWNMSIEATPALEPGPSKIPEISELPTAALLAHVTQASGCLYIARQAEAYFLLEWSESVKLSPRHARLWAEDLFYAHLHVRHLFLHQYCEQQQQELQRSQQLQQALFDISNLVYIEDSAQILFQKIHAIVANLMYAENFFIVRFNEKLECFNFLYYADSLDHNPIDPETEWSKEQMANSITLAMLRSKKSAWGPSLELSQKFGLGADRGLGPESIDWLGVPMLEEGAVVGGIVVQSYLPNKQYTQTDLNLLSYVAEHIQQSLTRREQTDQLEQKVEERTAKLSLEIYERQRSEEIQSALFNITRLTSQSETLEQFYPAMHHIVGQLLDAKNIYIAFLDDQKKRLVFPYYVDESGTRPRSRPLSNGLTEWVLQHKSPVLLNEQQVQQLINTQSAIAQGTIPKCWLGVPLISQDKAIGVIALQSYHDSNAYSTKEQELLMFVSTHIAQALEKIESSNRLKTAYIEMESNVKRRTHELELSNRALREQITRREHVEEKLKYDALHDQLTGLPNRTQLYHRLITALASHRHKPKRIFAVFFIDLDRFKIINDSMGHWVGDELLKIVSERILRCVRKPDLVARLGGDEFAVVLQSIRNIHEAQLVAERMLSLFMEPVYIQGKELYISASIGIATAQKRHNEPDEILRDADIALYRSKEKGRNRFTFFDDDLHQTALNTLILEGDLRRALSRGELFPYYQPIIELKHRRILGFEALMRWQHPEKGLLQPSAYSEVAKETGLIEPIDWMIFDRVCRDMPILLGMADYVSINVSPRHLGQENFASRLLDLLSEYGVKPSNLHIEVTEDALIEHPDLGLKLLNQLNNAGIKIKLDDFGTGYSSFSYLHKYPLDFLKVDGSFITNLNKSDTQNTAPLVQAIQALGQSLGLSVIAEGVETEAQFEMLKTIGLQQAQGYLFAHPASLEQISRAGLEQSLSAHPTHRVTQ